MHMMNVWKSIRRRIAPGDMNGDGTAPNLIPTSERFEQVVSDCLELLNGYSAGTIMYILNCLCPDDFALIIELVRLDLSPAHQHKRLSEKDVPPRSDSYKELLSLLRAHTSKIPAKDYPHFWLELTRNWLLTCPIDPDYYREDETGKDLFCRRLRIELVERILNIS